MKEIPINSWDEFVEQVEDLQSDRDKCADGAIGVVPELLYRGQPDSRMRLETTLERAVRSEVLLTRYYRFVSVIKAKIESLTGKEWPIPSEKEFDESLNERCVGFLQDLRGYEYLAYLRHHGLPSPLLDWTRSPYMAAHFAMAAPPRDEKVKEAAVFVYLETANGCKSGDVDAPAIQPIGLYIKTHRRHYLQHSEYTICTQGTGHSMHFASHEEVVARDDKGQDLLWKMVIPVAQRRDFLKRLEWMNITSFSLFGTEDKLMEDISLSEIFLRGRLNPSPPSRTLPQE